jgi:hypothetical protein
MFEHGTFTQGWVTQPYVLFWTGNVLNLPARVIWPDGLLPRLCINGGVMLNMAIVLVAMSTRLLRVSILVVSYISYL